jgi:hypothetical protein
MLHSSEELDQPLGDQTHLGWQIPYLVDKDQDRDFVKDLYALKVVVALNQTISDLNIHVILDFFLDSSSSHVLHHLRSLDATPPN